MPVRAIVFDLDGTLVDSLEDIAVALDAALEEQGIALPTRATVRSWIGGGARALVAKAAPQAVEEVLARFRVHYAASPAVHTKVYAELEPVLDQIVRGHVALAILTNKPHDLAVRIVDDVLKRWPFATVIGQRHGIPLKPDPQPALMVAEELGVPPEHCALVGDAATDIETAHAAGMIPVGVTWGYRSREELISANPSLLVDHPADLRVLVS